MPARSNKSSRARHGTKNLILQVLESTTTGPAISTPDLINRIRKLGDTEIPEPTIRAALRAQIGKGTVQGRKRGRTMFLKLGSALQGTPMQPQGRPGRKPKVNLGERSEVSPIPEAVTALAVEGVHHAGTLPEVDQLANVPALPSEERVGTVPPSQVLPYHHKLAVGEVLVLHIDENHIETVTNLHGRVVLERHPRPKL